LKETVNGLNAFKRLSPIKPEPPYKIYLLLPLFITDLLSLWLYKNGFRNGSVMTCSIELNRNAPVVI
jgi:hypothetical protein